MCICIFLVRLQSVLINYTAIIALKVKNSKSKLQISVVCVAFGHNLILMRYFLLLLITKGNQGRRDLVIDAVFALMWKLSYIL